MRAAAELDAPGTSRRDRLARVRPARTESSRAAGPARMRVAAGGSDPVVAVVQRVAMHALGGRCTRALLHPEARQRLRGIDAPVKAQARLQRQP